MKTLLNRMLPLLILMSMAAVAIAAVGDDDRPIISVGPWAGTTFWSDEIGLDDGLVYGARGGVHLLRWLTLEGSLGWSGTEHLATAGDVDVLHKSFGLVADLRPDSGLNPYLLAGWGQVDVTGDLPTTDWHLNGWEAGAGLKIRLGGDKVNRRDLRLEVRDLMTDLAAGFPNGSDMTHNLVVSAGLQFHFGRGSKDADLDGVRDRDDLCADTPSGALVDTDGCPSDSDGDGVLDGLDTCDDTPDGAVIDDTGCPVDTDGDGVYDGLDTCPGTLEGAVIDDAGCPVDTDGDGVFDGLDQCPDTPSHLQVDDAGCPIAVTETEEQLLDTGMIRTSEVKFRSGSSELDLADTSALDEISAVLGNWPELRIEVGGHTDSQGSEELNQRLSEERAQAVLDYMVQRYPDIRAGQFTVTGYGESRPVADNGTAEGRAANRRVEFRVLNTEVIKRVIESQKLLER